MGICRLHRAAALPAKDLTDPADTVAIAIELKGLGKGLDGLCDRLSGRDFGDTKIIGTLKVQPALRFAPKIAFETKGRIRAHASLAFGDFAETRVRDMQGQRHRPHTNTHGLDVVFHQNFAGVDRTHTIFKHDELRFSFPFLAIVG
jgi:hypothetical protein